MINALAIGLLAGCATQPQSPDPTDFAPPTVACDLGESCDALPPRPTHITCGQALRDAATAGESVVWPDNAADLGCFTPGPTLEPTADLVPYTVAAPLFSEGSEKRRWLVLGPDTTITPSAAGPWGFPVGALLLKEFAFVIDTPAGWQRRPLELRAMLRTQDGWSFASWASVQGAMLLVPERGATATFTVPPDQGDELPWLYPSQLSCSICHRIPDNEVAAVRTDQLHHPTLLDSVLTSQLAAMDSIGLFEPPLHTLGPLPSMVDPQDPRADVDHRARAWLHANCAHCHQPGGFVPPDQPLDLRYTTPLSLMSACRVPKHAGTLTPGDQLIVPGDPSASHLLQRIRTDTFDRMPPDGSTRNDAQGLVLLTAWVEHLRGCD